LIVNLGLDFNITASDAVWAAIDAALGPSDPAGGAKATFNQLLTALPTDLGAKFHVTAITGVQQTDINPWGYGTYQKVVTKADVINASITTRNNTATAWEDPAFTAAEYLQAWMELFGTVMGEPTPWASVVAEGNSVRQDAGNFTNVPIAAWRSSLVDNTTEWNPNQIVLPTNATPVNPMEINGKADPSSMIVKPKEINFTQWYDFISNLYTEGKSTDTSIATWPSTLSGVISQAGISDFYVDANSIAFVIDLAQFNQTMFFTPEEIAMFNATGVQSNLIGKLHFALEYNSQGLLNRFGFFFDGNMNVNVTAIMGETMGHIASVSPKAADSGVLPITVSVGQTMTQNGQTPLTKTSIEADQVGAQAPGGSAFTPGYPVEWVGIIGVVSVVGLILRKRMH